MENPDPSSHDFNHLPYLYPQSLLYTYPDFYPPPQLSPRPQPLYPPYVAQPSAPYVLQSAPFPVHPHPPYPTLPPGPNPNPHTSGNPLPPAIPFNRQSSYNYASPSSQSHFYRPTQPHAPYPDPHISGNSLPRVGSSSSFDTQSSYSYPSLDRQSSYNYPSLDRQSSYNFASPRSQSPSFGRANSLQSYANGQIQNSLKVLLLHGNLDVWILEATKLPNMDMFHSTVGNVARITMFPGIIANKVEQHFSNKITSDPYVSISVSDAVIGRTFVISNSENPVWTQHFNIPVAHYASQIHFNVKDNDVLGSQRIGRVTIPVEALYSGQRIEGTYPILNNGKPVKTGATLKLSVQFTSVNELKLYRYGSLGTPDFEGIPGTYFPLRKGGRVKLYQDAHVTDGSLPLVHLDSGVSYVHGKCWRDIFEAISHATCLIYIAGWSVWDKVTLVREAGHASRTLGELLMSKSQVAVRVLLLLWDDPTSRNILGYKTEGVMSTHDENTRRFFKHSSVRVLLCPRTPAKRHSWAKAREVQISYTHHQKTVIVDADAGNGKRKIVAFVGGLDLCNGRFDTPDHSLFRTLETVHKGDYHNPTYAKLFPGGPREPWHDMHSKIDGPAAYDVLANFEDRWTKAFKARGLAILKGSPDDFLLNIGRMQNILGVNDFTDDERDPDNWHVQVFRSIDSSSVKDFPKDPRQATAMNLACGKNFLIDASMHTAYVTAIRGAKHFLYIENQYFIGSSYNWSTNSDAGANNLIPMEIALKIADKIRANERFAAYIVIPMWPEGNPTALASQSILFWQSRTMQMMYEVIYKALEETGLERTFSPQDYLNFFCLGNREAGTPVPYAESSPQGLGQSSRRFMIYVHSKGMIVDDEYVIVGSANINERSMAGSRDSEIAMGAYQPRHTWEGKGGRPRGEVYGYRMSLWGEHMGGIEPLFEQPESVECVRRVRGIGEINWGQYVAPEVTEMRGHLMKYPLHINAFGKLNTIPGCDTFPDVGGNILGTFMGIQENLTT